MVLSAILSVVAASAAQPRDDDGELLCKLTQLLAEMIMEDRQNEKPMTEVLARHENTPNPEARIHWRNMVVRAYQRPAYRTPENRRNEAKSFANEETAACFAKLYGVKR